MPDHFVGMQALVVLVYAFLAGAGWTLGTWIGQTLTAKLHK
jgi:hypothetical protein